MKQILLLLLLFVLVACSEPIAPVEPAQPTVEPTVTSVPSATPDRTATAQVQAATATAVALASEAAIMATAEAEALFAQATLIFRDEFVDNRNAWYTGVFQEIETNTIEDGVFKVHWSGRGTSYELYMVRELGNMIAEAECQIIAGARDASCGLIFGQREDIGYYKYEIFSDYYRLFRVPVIGEPITLLEGNPAELWQANAANHLRVIREGEHISITLNEVLLGAATDATYLEGKVGVTTSSYSDEGNVELWFDHFAIWELP
ncbi:hypothetical protein [Candidatus Viridilinea mediisalina]|uniref:hypothetical protein n=1 Tax=Candidatus Viridilinea mediisalina TaxID=2024553 RepID=UPI000F5A4A00|nr:hypothetical protein [Candidatus Viridilinea mediisalina]